MSRGYDQFFKKAKEAAEGKPAEPVAMKKKPVDKIAITRSSFKKSKTRKPFPVGAMIFSIFGFATAYYGYQNHERLGSLFGDIEISLFGSAHAESAEAVKPAEPSEPTKPVSAEPTGEDLNHLIKLVERKKELDAREEELSRLESELSQQKEVLHKQIAEMEKMRNSISTMLEERVKADDQKIDTLVQFYSNMKPPQAAKIFETIDEELAVQILGRMKKKNAADVLNLMKSEKAQMFTEKFAGYKRTTASTSKPEVKPTEPQQEEETTNEEPSVATKP